MSATNATAASNVYFDHPILGTAPPKLDDQSWLVYNLRDGLIVGVVFLVEMTVPLSHHLLYPGALPRLLYPYGRAGTEVKPYTWTYVLMHTCTSLQSTSRVHLDP